MKKDQQPAGARVDVHVGSVIMRLAGAYRGLIKTIVENIQNAIDADAYKILVLVDLVERKVYVYDNGVGASPEEYNEALSNIGETNKQRGKLGRFGIGKISPLNKFEALIFTSIAMGAQCAYSWRLTSEIVRQQRDAFYIEPKRLTCLPAVPEVFRWFANDYLGDAQPWRTVVAMEGLTEDSVVGAFDFENFKAELLDPLGPTMAQKGVTCRAVVRRGGRSPVEFRDIKPSSFTGKRLGTFSIDGLSAGSVALELYQAPQTDSRRRGRVFFSDTTIYPIDWAKIRNQIRTPRARNVIDPDGSVLNALIDAFNSGYFEGIVVAEKIELNLDRDGFEFNQAMRDLLFALACWYHEEGNKFFEEEKLANQQKRWHDLTREVLEGIRAMPDELWQRISRDVQAVVGVGSIGDGHSGVGIEAHGSKHGKRADRGRAKPKPDTSASKDAKRSTPYEPRGERGAVQDTPIGVAGAGARRSLITGDSLGIWIEIVDFPYDATRLFKFDRETGVLSFNSNCPIWLELDGANARRRTSTHDRWIKALEAWVLTEVLSFIALPQETFEVVCERLNDNARFYVRTIIQGERSTAKG